MDVLCGWAAWVGGTAVRTLIAGAEVTTRSVVQ